MPFVPGMKIRPPSTYHRPRLTHPRQRKEVGCSNRLHAWNVSVRWFAGRVLSEPGPGVVPFLVLLPYHVPLDPSSNRFKSMSIVPRVRRLNNPNCHSLTSLPLLTPRIQNRSHHSQTRPYPDRHCNSVAPPDGPGPRSSPDPMRHRRMIYSPFVRQYPYLAGRGLSINTLETDGSESAGATQYVLPRPSTNWYPTSGHTPPPHLVQRRRKMGG